MLAHGHPRSWLAASPCKTLAAVQQHSVLNTCTSEGARLAESMCVQVCGHVRLVLVLYPAHVASPCRLIGPVSLSPILCHQFTPQPSFSSSSCSSSPCSFSSYTVFSFTCCKVSPFLLLISCFYSPLFICVFSPFSLASLSIR